MVFSTQGFDMYVLTSDSRSLCPPKVGKLSRDRDR